MGKLLRDKNLKVWLQFYFEGGKSWWKKGKLIGIGRYKGSKGDVDKLIKRVLEGGNKDVWEEDNEVVDIDSQKMYGEEWKMVMVIKEVD